MINNYSNICNENLLYSKHYDLPIICIEQSSIALSQRL